MFKKTPKTLVYFLVLIFSFFILFLPKELFPGFKFSLLRLVTVPMYLVSLPFKEAKKLWFYRRNYNESLRLKAEVDAYKAKLVGLEEVLRENSRLAKLLQLKRDLIFSSVVANVIVRDPSNWTETIIIDKGKNDGLDVGMPVVNASGVVGKISEVGDHKAKVLLLTDPNFSVVALVQRSREVGLVSGTLTDQCRMRYLSPQSDVQKGDQVITSKLSSSFPEGLVIGEVVAVRSSESSPTTDCIIRPAVSLSQIEEVLVIQSK